MNRQRTEGRHRAPRRVPRALAVLLALCVATSVGDAQQPTTTTDARDLHDHRGFWIGFGLGPGALSIDCESNCGAATPSPAWERGRSGGFHLAMGGTPRQNLLLGGELGGQVRWRGESTATVAWISFVSQWYPRPRSGLFVRTGLGIGGAVLEDRDLGLVGDLGVSTTGFSLQGGVGYDVRFGGKFALTPFAQYVVALGDGDQTRAGGRRYQGPEVPSALHAGLSFNWY